MEVTSTLSKAEEDILTCFGYIVMRWNYVEYCARQILRTYIPEGSMDDSEQLKLSARPASWIEGMLKSSALPHWSGEGKAYLEGFIEAYAVAREYRNHLAHGIFQTASAPGSPRAVAVLFPAMPKNNRSQLPSFISLSEMKPVADHLFDLGNFAQKVMVGFDRCGVRALNKDGTLVLPGLPAFVSPLPPCQYSTTDWLYSAPSFMGAVEPARRVT